MDEDPLGPLPGLMHVYYWREGGKPVLDIWFVHPVNLRGIGRPTLREFGEHYLDYTTPSAPRFRPSHYDSVEGITGLRDWLIAHRFDDDKCEMTVAAVTICWFITIADEADRRPAKPQEPQEQQRPRERPA